MMSMIGKIYLLIDIEYTPARLGCFNLKEIKMNYTTSVVFEIKDRNEELTATVKAEHGCIVIDCIQYGGVMTLIKELSQQIANAILEITK